MPRDQELGKLIVDIDADASGLKTGMNKASSVLKTSVGIMKGLVATLAVSLVAIGGTMVAVFGKLGMSFLGQQKNVQMLNLYMKNFGTNSKRSLKEVQLAMLDMAKATGVSSREQTEALNVLLRSLEGIADFDYIQDILLPMAIDWAFASGKSPAEAAKDIADAFMGNAPEEIIMPVKAKFEMDNPGKMWDDLTKAEQWNEIVKYLEKFGGAAETQSNTIFGAFGLIKTAIIELFDAIAGSVEAQPLIDSLKGIADEIFNLAERIRNGDMPENLKGIIDGFNKFIPKVAEFIKGLTWEKIEKFAKAVWGLGKAVLFFGTLAYISPIILGLKDAFLLLSGLKLSGISTGLAKLGKSLVDWTLIKFSNIPILSSLGQFQLALAKYITDIGLALQSGNLLTIFKAVFGGIPAVVSQASTSLASALGITTTALNAWIVFILAAVVLFVAAWKNNWGDLRDRTKEVWDDIKDVFSEVFGSIKNLFGDFFGDLKDIFKLIVDGIKDFKENFLKGFDLLPQGVQTILIQLADWIGTTFAVIIEVIGFAVKTIGNVLGALVELFRVPLAVISTAIKIFIALITLQWDEIPKILSDGGKKISDAIGNVIKYFSNFAGDIVKVFGSIVSLFTGFIGSFVGKGKEWSVATKDFFVGIGNGVRDWGRNLGDKFKEMGKGIGSNLDDISKGFTDFGNKSKDKFNEIVTTTKSWGSDMGTKFNDMKTDVGLKLDGTFTSLKTFGSDSKNKFNEMVNNTGTWATNTGTKLAGLWSDTKTNLTGIFGSNKAYASDMSDTYDKNETRTGTWRDNIVSKFEDFKEKAKTKLDEMTTAYKEKFEGLVDKMNDFKEAATTKLSETFTNIKDKFSNIKTEFSETKTALSGHIEDYKTKFSEFKTALSERMGELSTNVKTKMGEVSSSMRTSVTDLVTATKEKATEFFNAGKANITKLWEGMVEILAGIPQKLKDKVSEMLKTITGRNADFKSAGKGILSAMWDGLEGYWTTFKSNLSKKVQAIRNLLPGSDAKEGPLSTLTKAGRGLFSAMQKGMNLQAPKFLGDLKGALGDASDLIPSPVRKEVAFEGVNYGSMSGGVNVYIQDSFFTSERAKRELIDMIDSELGNRNR